MVARIPYLTTEPRHLLVASEVATMDYLRSHGIPIQKIYGYSATSDNPAGTEYIFMEVSAGTNLGDIWYELGEKARTTVVRRLVELETRILSLGFPASGSIYYSGDLDASLDRVEIDVDTFSSKGPFCIGPDTTLALWFGNRLSLDVFRGPCEYRCCDRPSCVHELMHALRRQGFQASIGSRCPKRSCVFETLRPTTAHFPEDSPRAGQLPGTVAINTS